MDFLQKHIYNTYLKYSRHNQPWKPRKDFSNLSEEISFHLEKLKNFFTKFKHIKIEDFFYAPLSLYPEFPNLHFFTTRAAIKSYNNYQKLLLNQNPDSQIDKIKEGFLFIGNFCSEHSIPLSEYLNHTTGYMPTWMEHYRQYQVNPYCLMELGDLKLKNIPEEELNLWAPNLIDNFSSYKNRYHISKEAKNVVKTATERLQTLLQKTLTSVSS